MYIPIPISDDELNNLILKGPHEVGAGVYALAKELQRERQANKDLIEGLKNPATVRVNYLRGSIACQPLIDYERERERERCAKIAENSDAWPQEGADIAKAIRGAPSVPLGDGWVEWTGGKCPATSGTVVSFRRRSGAIVVCDNPEEFNWGRYNHDQPTDIIAYRVEPIAPDPEPS